MAPLIVVVGPTASGKSAVSLELAERYNGEIICADSRTIFTHMDIGTAKPSKADQARVPHWGLDLIEPGVVFTAANFKKYAEEKIADIRARGKVPFLVGGSGLYVDAVIFDYQFGPTADPRWRAELESMSLSELHKYCIENNVILPENDQNKRYVIRAIEQKNINRERLTQPIDNTIIVGITTEKSELHARIAQRAEQLFDDGMIEEATELGQKYGWESEAMTGNIYRLVYRYLNGELNKAELKDRFIISDRQLAKRQLTWLKRNQYIHWLSRDDAHTYIAQHLASVNNS